MFASVLGGKCLPLFLVAAMILILPGCRKDGPGQAGRNDDHPHLHEENELLVTTGWSAGLEVFAEYSHLIADRHGHLDLHLTHLPEGTPVAEGPVQLVWTGEQGQSFTRVVAEPARPGLFLAEVDLPTAGHWSLQVRAPGMVEPVTLTGLHVAASEVHDHHHHGPESEPVPGLITMTKEQQWSLQVAAAPVGVEDFAHPLRVAATVEAPPARRLVITTPVTGVVGPLAHGRLPVLGQTVQAGAPLLEVRVPLTGNAAELVAAEAELIRTREDLGLARAELERAESLLSAGAAARKRVDEARAAVAAQEARHQAAARLLQGSEPARVIRAPISGVVVAVNASPGSLVPAGGAVLTVLDPSVVWVRGHIPETALDHLPPAPRARLGIHGDLNRACDIEGARLVYLAPEIDRASRTAAVVYEVDNHDLHLRPGQSLGLALSTRTSQGGMVIPRDALVDEHGRPVVYVQTGGESFVKRYLTLGGEDGRRCLVTDGLQAGERVVVQAPWAVKLAGVATQVPGHGHTH